MPEKNRRLKDHTATFLIAVVFLASPVIISAAHSPVEKLSEDPIKSTPGIQNPPPPPSCPSPPPPSPPPPYPTPPSWPPPPKMSYCPPPPKESYFPPPPPYVYASPPGDLYPVDHDFGAAAAREIFTTVKLIALGVIGFMILWK